MAIIENKWALISLVVLCWALAASFMGGYYYYQYSDLDAKTRGHTIFASLGIEHDNESAITWFNETKINAGATLLDLTRLLVPVNFTESLSGAFVNAIDGVPNSYPKCWMWWSWSSFGWNFGPIACDRYIVAENETLLWCYQDISVYPPPPP